MRVTIPEPQVINVLARPSPITTAVPMLLDQSRIRDGQRKLIELLKPRH
jgi:hypothetical protein